MIKTVNQMLRANPMICCMHTKTNIHTRQDTVMEDLDIIAPN